jgi:ABC-type Fe3+/spermidine/putrescine transport system ATPase subunit
MGIEDGVTIVQTPLGVFPVSGNYSGEVTVLVRPEKMELNQKARFEFSGVVIDRSFRGSMCRAVIEVDGIQLSLEIPCSEGDVPSPGNPIRLGFDPAEAIQVLA